MELLCLDQWNIILKQCHSKAQILLLSSSSVLKTSLKITKIFSMNCNERKRLWKEIEKNKKTIKLYRLSIENLFGYEDKLPANIDYLEIIFRKKPPNKAVSYFSKGPEIKSYFNLNKSHVKTLNLINTNAGTRRIINSSQIPNVENLYLWRTTINLEIHSFPKLKSLMLQYSRFNNMLKCFSKLEHLSIMQCGELGYEFEEELNELKNLKSLSLDSCYINIPDLPLLKTLFLWYSRPKIIFASNLEHVKIVESKGDVEIKSMVLKKIIWSRDTLKNIKISYHAKLIKQTSGKMGDFFQVLETFEF